ncbi:MAG: hypothetical protein IPG22_02620 [Acidobacteria bacterium]|nr:hypothetical protein [Acidobacteriota bacterium]
MTVFLLSLIDWNQWKPENLFGGQVLERTPAGLSIVYIIAVGILIGFLVITFFDNFRRHIPVAELELPKEVNAASPKRLQIEACGSGRYSSW